MSTPAIDYTDKDFASLRAAMLRLAAQRLPEWTDRSPSDLVMVLIDLFAYCGDIVAYYQDRIASELFPSTATERASLVDLLRLVGYEFTPAVPARADLRLTFARPDPPADPRVVTIASGTAFRAEVPGDGPLEFVYTGADLTIDLLSGQVRPDAADAGRLHYDALPVEQGILRPPRPIGSGTGEVNQTFRLPEARVVLDSVVVEVDEGAQRVPWRRAAADTPSTDPLAREYRQVVDADDVGRLVFPDRPVPVGVNNVWVGYRVCAGARGNVAAGAIAEAVSTVPLLVAVANTAAAAGGRDIESPESALRNAPSAFRSQQRAVTAEDYAALTRRTGTVAKVRVHSPSWNRVDLYVAPTGPALTPLPDALRDHLLAVVEQQRAVCTTVSVFGARPAPVDIAATVVVDERFVASHVVAQVRAAVTALLAFEGVDFAQTLYLSDVYAAIEAVPGVLGATVQRFRPADRVVEDVDAELARAGLPPLASLPDFVRSAVTAEVESTGRIDAGEFEIPVPGTVEIGTAPR